MQIHVPKQEITVAGALRSQKFAIDLGPHLMKVLSGLYSNREGAVVREYGTNMYDGHVKAGTLDVPAVIHVPSELEPYIEFKDFGTGMSIETLFDVFPVYGRSTKRDSNLEVGGLGVGAKTAFCYTGAESWTVESRYNGERYVCAALIGEDGLPDFIHMATLPTTEANGVTVKIPVKTADMPRFTAEILKFAMYYPAPLTLVGVPNIQVPERKHLLAGTDWAITPANLGAVAIMGNVAYPIDVSRLVNRGIVDYDFFYGLGFEFHVGIGDVDITPSREALMYTERTEAALRKIVTTFKKEIKGHAKTYIADAATKWDALQRMYESWGLTSLRRYLVDVPYKGEKLSLSTGLRLNIADLESRGVRVTGYKVTSARATMQCFEPGREWAFSPSSGTTHVIVDDGAKAGTARIRQLLQTRYCTRDWQGKLQAERHGTVLHLVGIAIDEVRALLDGYQNVEALGALPYTPPTRTGTPVQVKRLNSSSEWEPVEAPAEGGYYVGLEGREVIDGHARETLHKLRRALIASKILPEDTEVYGIPRTRASLEEKDEWVAFFPEAQRLVQQHLKKRRADVAFFNAWEAGVGGGARRLMELLMDAKTLPAVLPAPLQAIRDATARRKRLSWSSYQTDLTLIRLADLHKWLDEEETITPDMLVQPLLDQSPLLRLYTAVTGRHQYAINVEHFAADLVAAALACK